jgi:hypothetical protein
VIKEGSTKIIGQRVMYHVYSFVVWCFCFHNWVKCFL